MSRDPKKVSFKRADAVIPLPEALNSFRQDADSSVRVKWEVEETLYAEETSADFSTHTFRTTVLRDEASKFYRNRESVRIRAGLNDPTTFAVVANTFSPGILKSAEEMRITRISKSLGFNTDVLKNGAEKTLGERLAEDGTGNAWNVLVPYGLSLVGTKAFNSLLVGVRRHNPDWADVLRDMSTQVLNYLDSSTSTKMLVDTEPMSYRLPDEKVVTFPYGFFHTLAAANIAQKYMLTSGELQTLGEGDGSVVVGDGTEVGFATLIIDESVELTKTVRKSLLRKYRADMIGTDIRYPERLLTDPHRRIFGRKKPLEGGIVLIDTSGSMELNSKDIHAILDAAPGALVMAYSHKSNSVDVPNLFILADRGKQVENLETVNYRMTGNGVDGPALTYAVKRRFRREPIIWVCDGLVTGSDDRRTEATSKFCAELVVKHRIITTPEVSSAIEMLRTKRYVSKKTSLDRYIKEVKKARKGF